MPKSLRQKASLLRKRHILDAAIKVFAERGFDQATIRDVANEAGVSDGTIYNSFENKAALLLSLLDPLNEVDAASANAPEPVSDDVHDYLRALLRRRWNTFTPATLNVLRTVFSQALINERLRALYMRRVVTPAVTLPEPFFEKFLTGTTLKPLDVPMTLRIITAACIGLVMLRLLGDTYLIKNWARVPDHLASVLLEGLLAERGFSS